MEAKDVIDGWVRLSTEEELKCLPISKTNSKVEKI